MLNGPVASRLEQIIHEVSNEHDWKIVQLAIQPDHVHLFIRTDPYTLPTDIARLIKGRSSRDMRKEFPHLARMQSLWTRSAFYSTAGNVSSETIQNYSERQSKRDEEKVKEGSKGERARGSEEYHPDPALSDSRPGQDAARTLPGIY